MARASLSASTWNVPSPVGIICLMLAPSTLADRGLCSKRMQIEINQSMQKGELSLLLPSAVDNEVVVSSSPSPSPSSSSSPVQLYAFRWVILGMYFVLLVANSAVFITFGVIDEETKTCFSTSLLAVNMMSGVSGLSAIFLLFPSVWLMKRIGIRKSMFLAALCQLVCGVIRIVVPPLPVPFRSDALYFWTIFVSQCVGAIPNGILAALPAEISSHWFGENERSIATALGALAQLIGIGGGQAFSGYYIGGQTGACHNFDWMFITQGILSVAAALPPMLFFREHPPSPPSYTNNLESHLYKPMTLWEEIKHCFALRSFVLIFIVFACGLGTFLTLWAVMQQLLGTLGTVWFATTISVIMVGAGVVGAAISGLIVDKWRNYRTVIFIAGPGGIIGLGLFFCGTYWTTTAGVPLIYAGSAVAGFFLIAMTPVVFEAVAEITFPVHEVTSTGLLLMFGNIYGIVFLVAFSVTSSATLILFLMLCIYGASFCIMIFWKPVYKRLELEKERKNKEVN